MKHSLVHLLHQAACWRKDEFKEGKNVKITTSVHLQMKAHMLNRENNDILY